MAANKSQGRSLGLFLGGLTATCAGIAAFSSGVGKAALVIGLVVLAASFFTFFKLKPLEGKPALGAQPAVMKLVGAVVTAGGWLLTLFGLHLTASVGGRMVIALVGLAISLVGMIGILPAACNKNAIWKA
ncbi:MULTISPECIES: hypothetical protein [Acidobacterium]|uniref:Uncharacterized protein n=1 Tax=Acidobacterium capsulatum (strain ATCC 51196 / DSM 11244 / BCRC 80197 / JCM 7670 / NBRC 15755 / NCIMB 13165 / 161) TaxID=240015 RepID=C1F585_ACIC5|nr:MULTISPECIES: hypothetical protein [Acidobacterium]ACO33712.1 hypothetical protein ACP_1256 [Acidobacterium capsulatum ATCC 51196]HCT59548.1 hypothetical protein [Acidobacterium sp.]